MARSTPGKHATLHVPVRHDLPPVVQGRTKGLTAASVIEAYIQTLAAAGLHQDAATLGTVYTALVANNYMKPRVRLALAGQSTRGGGSGLDWRPGLGHTRAHITMAPGIASTRRHLPDIP